MVVKGSYKEKQSPHTQTHNAFKSQDSNGDQEIKAIFHMQMAKQPTQLVRP